MDLCYYKEREGVIDEDGFIFDNHIGKAFIDFISFDSIDENNNKSLEFEMNPFIKLHKSIPPEMHFFTKVPETISQYVKATEDILNIDNDDLKELDTLSRYYIYETYVTSSFVENSVKVRYLNIPISSDILNQDSSENKILTSKELITKYKNSKFILIESYPVETIKEALYISFMKMVSNNIKVKKCKCCYKYFIPEGRIDTEYCDRTAPNSKKKCSEIGSMKKYHEKVNKNPILKEYNKQYKKINARLRLKKISQPTFSTWASESKLLRIQAISEGWTLDYFIIKLKELEV
jgi:hypothetical protein